MKLRTREAREAGVKRMGGKDVALKAKPERRILKILPGKSLKQLLKDVAELRPLTELVALLHPNDLEGLYKVAEGKAAEWTVMSSDARLSGAGAHAATQKPCSFFAKGRCRIGATPRVAKEEAMAHPKNEPCPWHIQRTNAQMSTLLPECQNAK